MKLVSPIIAIVLFISCYNCSDSVDYTEEFMENTSGFYLYNPDNLMQVYYEDRVLILNWKGGKVKPVALSQNEFFVPDMYKKLRFEEHPKTKQLYLSIVPEDETGTISYDYLKVPEGFKTPTMHLNSGNYNEALEGYLAIKKEDSMSPLINEWRINELGYKHLNKEKYDDAVAVFKLNATLHPNSFNVFDSLGEAFLKRGDSLQAYENFKLAYKSNPRNQRALRYVEHYEKK